MHVHQWTIELMRELLEDSSSSSRLLHQDMSKYSRRLQLTHIGSVGDAEFLANDIRVKKGLDGLGCLGDMGWYCVRAALWAYGFEKPVSVSAHAGKICHLCDKALLLLLFLLLSLLICVTTSLATLSPDLHFSSFSYSAVSQRRFRTACCSWIT